VTGLEDDAIFSSSESMSKWSYTSVVRIRLHGAGSDGFNFRLLECKHFINWLGKLFNPLTPELNPSAQRCLPRFFTGDFSF
jgi:hypothetical protein